MRSLLLVFKSKENRITELERRIEELFAHVGHADRCGVYYDIGCDCGFYEFLEQLRDAEEFK